MGLKRVVDLMYHPKTVGISCKIYEITANMGFAVMPKPVKEDEDSIKENGKPDEPHRTYAFRIPTRGLYKDRKERD